MKHLSADYKIAIIGGGAAGLYAAALFSARNQSGVVLIEKGERLGRKLSASGNGQGNLTNTCMGGDKYFSGNRSLVSDIVGCNYGTILSPFLCLFEADEAGRVYPTSRQASSLTDCLRAQIDGNIDVLLNCQIMSIKRIGKWYELCSDKDSITAERVIIACGGCAQKHLGSDGGGYTLAKQLGHSITPLFPSLVQLRTPRDGIKTLKGIRAACTAYAQIGERQIGSASGEVIFTEYGISGSAIFYLSAFVTDQSGVKVRLEFLPDITENQIADSIERKQRAGYDTAELLSGVLNNQLGRAIIKSAGSSLSHRIAKEVKAFTLDITGSLGFDYAQVTKGGVSMNEVSSTLESRYASGVYFIGEILDVDGQCGGYNLHWAFSSARRVVEALI